MNTTKRSDGYMQTGSGKPFSHAVGTSRPRIQGGNFEDEIELVTLDQKPSHGPATTNDKLRVCGSKDTVTVTTNVTVTREVL